MSLRPCVLLTAVFLLASCRSQPVPTSPDASSTLIPNERLVALSTEAATGLLSETGTARSEESLFAKIAAKDGPAVQLLLAAGISPNALSREKEPALTLAVKADAPDVVTALLDGGADVNAGGDKAPVFVAAELSRLECLRWLATYRGTPAAYGEKHRPSTPAVNPDARNSEGRTALFAAANSEGPDIAQVLLEAGWNPGASDAKGVTPVDRAFRRANGAMLRRLIEYGAPLDRRDDDEWTPLARAAATGATTTTIEMMLERGASLNVRDGQGRTALDLARLNKHDAITALLEKHGAKSGLPR